MKRLRLILQIAEWGTLAALPILSALRSIEPKQHSEPLRSILEFLIDRFLLFLFSFALAALALKIINQLVVEKYFANRSEIKRVLDSLHKNYFQDVPQGESFKHRVTLFKARRRYFTGKPSYLEIFTRSGTAYQQSKTWFPIDDEDEAANEGVVGRAWFTNAQCNVTDLPLWPEVPNPNPEDDPTCQEYARKGLTSVARVSKLTIKSRSLTATVVRMQSGQRWGILVLDSREPNGIATDPQKQALVTLSADLITQKL